MYPDRARMDFALGTMTPDFLHDIERSVNAAVADDHPIKVYDLPRDEAMQIPDLIRTKINLLPPEITRIRIVEIVGVDLQADGGTHVHSTREVGGIKVLRTENKGKENKRMEIALTDGDDEIKHERTEESATAPGERSQRHEEERRGRGSQWAQPRNGKRQGRGKERESVSSQWAAFSASTRADPRGLPTAGA